MRTVLYFLLATLAAMPLFAQDDVEARLRKLETEVETLKQENVQLRKDLGLQAENTKQDETQLRKDLGTEVVARQADVKRAGTAALQFGGLIQAQSEAGDKGDSRFNDGNTRFFLRRARVNASGKFVEDFSFRIEMDLAGSLSNTSAYRAQMTDGYINWGRFKAANVRVGQFKTPFGFEQLYADPRLSTAERSLVSDRLTISRQIGVQLSGAALDDRLNYAAGVFNGSGINQNFNDNDKLMGVARVGFVPFDGRLFGNAAKIAVGANAFRDTDTALSVPSDFGIDSTPATSAKDNIFTGRRRGIGYDAQAEIGRAEVWGEYLRDTFEPASHLPAGKFSSDGWYAQATYYLIPGKLQLAERFETFDPSDVTAHDATRSTVSGVNWYLKGHDLKLQFDWMRSNVPGLSKTQQKVIARVQTAF
ncbi:MAG TPA: porin [Thermoanaerobaculia bacterium]|nr:porin [Thermoanaerobaculia bacterium]